MASFFRGREPARLSLGTLFARVPGRAGEGRKMGKKGLEHIHKRQCVCTFKDPGL